jgi:hypothetical protein
MLIIPDEERVKFPSLILKSPDVIVHAPELTVKGALVLNKALIVAINSPYAMVILPTPFVTL